MVPAGKYLTMMEFAEKYNLNYATVRKQVSLGKIESYYIHCFPFYLFIWHFYRLQKKQLNLSRVICTTSTPAIYCLRAYLPTLAKSSSECHNLGLSQR